MNKVYEVVFKSNGKRYYFKSNEEITPPQDVIVETEKGTQYAKVVAVANSTKNLDMNEIKSIDRLATEEDNKRYLDLLKSANNSLEKAKEIVEELGLEMKLLDAQYTFDKKQVLFNFVADERVDFRELARRLAGLFHTRIELRQIGARDKAKETGGIGICGRKLCCAAHLNRMDAVSINMAKNQGLALNPTKINGCCGRLLCCLNYEDETYSECQKGLPYVGAEVFDGKKRGRVINVDVLQRKYKVDFETEIKEYELKDDECYKRK